MLFFIFTVAAVIGVAVYVTKKTQHTNSTIPTTPPSTIHDEIAKTVETIKTTDPVVLEAPFVAEEVETPKPKKTSTTKKPAPKMKSTPKKKKVNA